MAEIEMEHRHRRNVWPWVAALVVVALIAVGAWFLFARDGTGFDAEPAAEQPAPGEPAPAPDRPQQERSVP